MADSILFLATDVGFNMSSAVGTLAFAFSGFLMGVRHKLDIMGLCITSTLPAVGGGIIRDILINKIPSSLVNPEGFIIVASAIILGFAFKLHKVNNLENRLLFVVSDSLGLVAFSITGALIGIEAGLNIFGIIILSFLTAVGGGIIRDILVNDVPVILQSGFYGSIAVIVAISLYLIDLAGYNNTFSILCVFIAGITLRLLAHFKKWNLPKIQY